MIKIRIKPTRVLFLNEENYFGIYGATVHDDDLASSGVKLNQYNNISIKGVMPKLGVGQEYVATLVEDSGSSFAGSYLVESIRQDKPTTVAEQKQFFEMILSEYQVKNIFDVYEGQDVIEMIQDDTFDYEKVKGIGKATYEKMKEKVLTSLDLSELLVFLGKHGIKYNMVQKLIKEYQNPQLVIQKIEENPYILTEVRGIGFKTADAIAKAMGYDMKSPHRIDSAIRYIIEEENTNGHSWVGRKQLLNKAIDLVGLSKKLIEERMDEQPKGVLKVDDDRFTVFTVFDAEEYVAMRLTEFKLNSTPFMKKEEVDAFLTDYCERNNVELEENQYQFFHDWNENNILMLVGGGGMGKSWLQNILLEMISKKRKGISVSLLAPTGKASKVMTGYTGKEAMTIHRKAGVHGEDEEGKFDIWDDVIIVDESSMCDIFILSKLFKAIKNPNIRIMFVGDDFQLPSVGVGNFLYDILHSSCIKVSRLKKVFRQSDGGILDIATKIRNGQSFLHNSDTGRIVFGKDLVCWLVDSDYIRDGISKNYAKLMKKYSQEDVAILTPTNKGRLGTVELNKMIQKIVNPESDHKKEKAVGKKDSPTIYRVGDRVMNTVNTYDIEMVNGGTADVFNGDTGKVIDIDETDKCLIIDFEGVVVKMSFSIIMTNLMHSWAMTIHKSQGSQYKVVILVIDKSSKYQLNANLLYTGVSRATEYVLLLAQADAINHAITKFINMERRSFLQELLHSASGNGKVMDAQGAKKVEIIDEEPEEEPEEIMSHVDVTLDNKTTSQMEEVDMDYYM